MHGIRFYDMLSYGKIFCGHAGRQDEWGIRYNREPDIMENRV